MAEYTERLPELQEDVRPFQQRDLQKAGESGAEQAQVLSRYTGFMAAMTSYMDWRDKVLGEAVSFLQEESSSITGINQQTRWIEIFARRSGEAPRIITDAAKEVEKIAPELLKFAEIVAAQEGLFFSQLGRAPLGFIAGQLQEYTADFKRESNNLTDKWKALGDSDRPIDQKVADTTKAIQALFEETVAKVIAEQKGIAAKAEAVKFDPGKPLTGSNLGTIAALAQMGVQAVMNALAPYRTSTATYVQTLMDMNRAEETLIIYFSGVREAVRGFMQKTNFATATQEYNDAVANSLAMAAACPTARSRDDAKRFVDRAVTTIQPIFDKFKKEHVAFIDTHRDIFVGPVGDKTVEELLELSTRLESWQDIERYDLPARLDAAFQDCANTWIVNVDGLSDDDKTALSEVWKKELDKLAEGIVAAKEDRVRDHLRSFFKEKLGALAERMRSSKGGGE